MFLPEALILHWPMLPDSIKLDQESSGRGCKVWTESGKSFEAGGVFMVYVCREGFLFLLAASCYPCLPSPIWIHCTERFELKAAQSTSWKC